MSILIERPLDSLIHFYMFERWERLLWQLNLHKPKIHWYQCHFNTDLSGTSVQCLLGTFCFPHYIEFEYEFESELGIMVTHGYAGLHFHRITSHRKWRSAQCSMLSRVHTQYPVVRNTGQSPYSQSIMRHFENKQLYVMICKGVFSTLAHTRSPHKLVSNKPDRILLIYCSSVLDYLSKWCIYKLCGSGEERISWSHM